jgi:Holliday junction resolvasome RuvABC endonuclease subunit
MRRRAFVGIDSSLQQPGLAVLWDNGERKFIGSLRTGSLRGGARLASIEKWIVDNVGDVHIVGCAIEGPSLASTHREFDLGEISGVCRCLASRAWEVEATIVPPSQLKLFADGNGRAEDLIHAVKRHWGVDVGTDDNAADAYALARLSRALVHGPGPRRCEAEVVRDILTPRVKTPKLRKTTNRDNV